MAVPKYSELFNPTLTAVKQLGGSATVAELNQQVAKLLHLSDEEIAEPHVHGTSTKLQYRVAWARSYLKAYGLLSNSVRGVWSVTPSGNNTKSVDPAHVTRVVRDSHKGRPQTNGSPSGAQEFGEVDTDKIEGDLEDSWREKLSSILIALPPAAFERLCQRLLRESGFVQVTVTGKSGDGGIDGVGIVRIGGLLGFPILFQCKRYAGSVSAGTIRDFRGAMIGRADRGLVITTGTFSRDARTEATRDGAPPIDLVDGEELMDKLRELRLGVDVKLIEEVSVIHEWFDTL
jgi:restriction system protein